MNTIVVDKLKARDYAKVANQFKDYYLAWLSQSCIDEIWFLNNFEGNSLNCVIAGDDKDLKIFLAAGDTCIGLPFIRGNNNIDNFIIDCMLFFEYVSARLNVRYVTDTYTDDVFKVKKVLNTRNNYKENNKENT